VIRGLLPRRQCNKPHHALLQSLLSPCRGGWSTLVPSGSPEFRRSTGSVPLLSHLRRRWARCTRSYRRWSERREGSRTRLLHIYRVSANRRFAEVYLLPSSMQIFMPLVILPNQKVETRRIAADLERTQCLMPGSPTWKRIGLPFFRNCDSRRIHVETEVSECLTGL
jgi:hypothetical protein